MAYEVTLLEVAETQDNTGAKTAVTYRFEILEGTNSSRAEVVLTYSGMVII